MTVSDRDTVPSGETAIPEGADAKKVLDTVAKRQPLASNPRKRSLKENGRDDDLDQAVDAGRENGSR